MLSGIELVQNRNGEVVTSSLQVAEIFGKRHDHVLRDIENITTQNWGVKNMFIESEYANGRNRFYKMYYLTRDGFTLLAMGFTGAKALQFKVDYINQFNGMEDYIKNNLQQHSYMIDDPIKRVEKWIEEQKESQSLILSIEEQKPKVLLAESIENSESLILVGDLAKTLKQNGYDIGQNRLFDRLMDLGYLIKGGDSKNLPTQRSMELELFRLVEGTRTSGDGIKITKTTKVTGKGQKYFVDKFLGSNK